MTLADENTFSKVVEVAADVENINTLTLTPESLVIAFSQFGDRLFGHIFEFEREVYTLLDVVV